MLYLNLISPQKKNEIEWRHHYETVRTSVMVLVVFLAFVSCLLIFSRTILQKTFAETVDRISLSTRDFQNNSMGVDISNRLRSVSQIQKKFVPWSYFVADIAKNANKDIKFHSLEINKSKEVINIRGLASQRSSLLDFKQNLESSGRFSQIIFPIDNILKKENINFNIRAEVNLDSFREK